MWITILRFMGDLPEPKYHTSMTDVKVTEAKLNILLNGNKNKNKFIIIRHNLIKILDLFCRITHQL